MQYMRNTLTKLFTLLRHLWLPFVVIILLVVVGIGMSAVLDERDKGARAASKERGHAVARHYPEPR